MSLQIRSAVARATREVVPFWPLSSFIAVNPMGGRESETFEAVAPIRSHEEFLADFRVSRITHADLVSAIQGRVPELVAAGSLTIGGRTWSPAELTAEELVHVTAPGIASPHRPDDEARLDDISAKWVAAYLDPHPLWAIPQRGQGFWGAWRTLASHDPHLPRTARRRLRELPAGAEDGLEYALAALGVAQASTEPVLRQESLRSPGWTAHIKWRAEHVGDIDLTSYLAVRMTLRWALGLPALSPSGTASPCASGPDSVWDRTDRLLAALSDKAASGAVRGTVARILALHPSALHAGTWQTAYESHYRHQLLASLPATAQATRTPHVQVVMCIDARSEGMRRHLETDPAVETYGFAGFFGVPIHFAGYQARGGIDTLPALLTARHAVTEEPADARMAARRTTALRVRDAFAAALHAGESTPAAPFALAETTGWFFGAASLLRTLLPSTTARSAERLRRLTLPRIDTGITVNQTFTREERAALAENAIRMMGLDRVAHLVVLTGHGSTSTNNMYQSALDCGACGGNPGTANSRAAAAIFNDPDVRGLLASRGIVIPDSSFFVAAEHNTVTDRIDVLDRHLIPPSHTAAVSEFLIAQAAAADLLVRERAADLPGAKRHSPARLRQRANDWAEVYPELGLIGNAAMVIAPRSMTRGVDLGRRVFLHSYLAELDPDGSALETIMTAPLVVAQWINHQYYFSTVDPDRWGAGTKTIHNPIGTLGVISGQTGDLRLGLPLQSVAVGRTALHEPLRLTVLIEAPLDLIGKIISRNQVLRNLFDNEWITLTARHDHHEPWHRYTSYGWTPLPRQIEGD